MNKSSGLGFASIGEKFSSRRLENPSRHFPYKRCEKVQRPVAQIGWSQSLIILIRCTDPLEREFYIRITRRRGWTKAVLIHQIARLLEDPE
jgi:hypothetical protein